MNQSTYICVGTLAAILTVTGCGGAPSQPSPTPGTLSVLFTPAPPSVAGLAASTVSVTLEGLTVLGDVAPDGRSMLSEVSVSLLDAGRSFVFSMLPQGLYSRVRSQVHEVHVEGTYGGTPLHIQLEMEGATAMAIDLRSPTSEDVTPGHDGTFTILIDGGAWFAGQLLDSAVASGGQIVIGGQSNPTVAQALAARVVGSFSLQAAPAK